MRPRVPPRMYICNCFYIIFYLILYLYLFIYIIHLQISSMCPYIYIYIYKEYSFICACRPYGMHMLIYERHCRRLRQRERRG